MSFILIFDIGKTNKKAFVFDEGYSICWESSTVLEEIADEDGDACEDLPALILWMKERYLEATERFPISAVNFSSYGASLVFLDAAGNVVTPLYNYLKAYPEELKQRFYAQYGGEKTVSRMTASPVLGNLNSGMQIYRLKHLKPAVFRTVRHVLHLPNYLGYVFSGHPTADITSVGCHTQLWDFDRGGYHDWLEQEELLSLLPALHDPAQPSTRKEDVAIGIGLHDSSAALIPYLRTFADPFVLLSTGTWNISIHPFNDSPLTEEELANDCLCFLRIEAQPLKASRLLAGLYHEQEMKKIAAAFSCSPASLMEMKYDSKIPVDSVPLEGRRIENPIQGRERNWQEFSTPQEAYHQLMADIVALQKRSTDLVLKGRPVKRLFVDGGFAHSDLFMKLLANAYPMLEVKTSEVAQASALGAALVMHESWNKGALPADLIKLL